MTTTEYRQALDVLPFGKRLPGAVYLLDPGADPRTPSLLRITVAELRKRLEISPDFNLLKFHTASPKISFLSYPDFEKRPHPVLAESIIIDLVTGKTRRDDYRARANPPILHRKETFLPPEHPLHDKFAKLTRQEEEAGLLDDAARIGFRLNWERDLAEKGLGFKGHRLVETGLATPSVQAAPKKKIHRHKTAIVRREISKPMKTLLELGQLRRGESFFDYGCGHGGDVDAIGKLGHPSGGWDPVHAPDAPKQSADAVNLGFVLNVIEDPAERVEALLDAWHHSSNSTPWRVAQAKTSTSPRGMFTPARRQARAVAAASVQQASSKASHTQAFFDSASLASSRLPLIPWKSSIHIGSVIAALPESSKSPSSAVVCGSPPRRTAAIHTELSTKTRSFIAWRSRGFWLHLSARQSPRDPPPRFRHWSRYAKCRSSSPDPGPSAGGYSPPRPSPPLLASSSPR